MGGNSSKESKPIGLPPKVIEKPKKEGYFDQFLSMFGRSSKRSKPQKENRQDTNGNGSSKSRNGKQNDGSKPTETNTHNQYKKIQEDGPTEVSNPVQKNNQSQKTATPSKGKLNLQNNTEKHQSKVTEANAGRNLNTRSPVTPAKPSGVNTDPNRRSQPSLPVESAKNKSDPLKEYNLSEAPRSSSKIEETKSAHKEQYSLPGEKDKSQTETNRKQERQSHQKNDVIVDNHQHSRNGTGRSEVHVKEQEFPKGDIRTGENVDLEQSSRGATVDPIKLSSFKLEGRKSIHEENSQKVTRSQEKQEVGPVSVPQKTQAKAISVPVSREGPLKPLPAKVQQKQQEQMPGIPPQEEKVKPSEVPVPIEKPMEPSEVPVPIEKPMEPSVVPVPIEEPMEPSVVPVPIEKPVEPSAAVNVPKEPISPPGNKELPPEKIKSLNQIDEIKSDAESLSKEVDEFSGTENDKQFIYLDEMLTRNLLKLDNVEIYGDKELRQIRREAIKFSHQTLMKLRKKAEEYNEKVAALKEELNEAENQEKLETNQDAELPTSSPKVEKRKAKEEFEEDESQPIVKITSLPKTKKNKQNGRESEDDPMKMDTSE